MLSKVLGGGLALSLISCFIIYGLWEKAQDDLVTLRSNYAILEGVNKKNQQSMDRLTKLAAANAESIVKLGKDNGIIRQQSLSHQTEISNLRASEAQSALDRPFERGNASHQRIVSQLLRFSGDGPGTVHPSDDKTIDSSGTDTP
jgi:hypothetical protein